MVRSRVFCGCDRENASAFYWESVKNVRETKDEMLEIESSFLAEAR